MKNETLRTIFLKTAFALLFAGFGETFAAAMNDDAADFGTHLNRNTINKLSVDGSNLGIPPARGVSFSDMAYNTPRNHLSIIDENTFETEVSGPSYFTDGSREQDITLRFSPKADKTEKHINGYSYNGYSSSSPEIETWLMILAGITLIGLQIVRGSKKSEPIYSSPQ